MHDDTRTWGQRYPSGDSSWGGQNVHMAAARKAPYILTRHQ
jgi:hypothetical protein